MIQTVTVPQQQVQPQLHSQQQQHGTVLSKPFSFLLQKAATSSPYQNPLSSSASSIYQQPQQQPHYLQLINQQVQQQQQYKLSQQPFGGNNNNLDQLSKKLEKIKQMRAMLKSKGTVQNSSTTILLPPHKKIKQQHQQQQDGMDTPGVKQFIGTLESLEKQYLRTSDVLKPEDFRPFYILQKSLPYVISRYESGQVTYDDYLCEQLKAIRQDLTVQGIENQFTLVVYETHARLAIKNKDLSELNQCQTRLNDLYRKGLKGNREEFLMYSIITLTLNDSSSELSKVFRNCNIKSLKSNDFVKYALEFHSNFSIFNFYNLFHNLYKKAPACGKSLIDIFMESIRKRALIELCQSHAPTLLEPSFICNTLGLKKDECLQFFRKMNIQLVPSANNEGSSVSGNQIMKNHLDSMMIDTKSTWQLLFTQ